jgi:hypothetical protein
MQTTTNQLLLPVISLCQLQPHHFPKAILMASFAYQALAR